MKLTLCLLIGLFALGIGCAQAAPALFAAKQLHLKSAVPNENEFTRPFEDPLPARLAKDKQLVMLYNCRDYLAVRDKIIGSDNETGYHALLFQTVPCIALALLKSASVANKSALPKDFLHYTNTAFYPATLWPAVSDVERKNHQWATSTLLNYTHQRALHKRNNESLGLEKSGWGLRFSLLARGDFNHDGWEDAAFQWQGYALKGSYIYSRLIVLTRTNVKASFIEVPLDQLLLK